MTSTASAHPAAALSYLCRAHFSGADLGSTRRAIAGLAFKRARHFRAW